MKEIWKDIQETDGDYEISNFGKVRSKERFVEYAYQNTFRKRKVSEKILKPKIRMKGKRVDCVEYNIRDKFYLISHLVYSYFISADPIPKGYCIAHADKNPLNNRSDNLVKVTWSDSRKLDHCFSKPTKLWQIERAKRGGQAMKKKAFLNRLKILKPHENSQKNISPDKSYNFN
ncbi:hypothetical protein J2810_004585 [Chryseobacterium rhizosphaerae]|uniref:NUMOD4 domain-containing protein n=1 Tax=Chryseobacterium rhizosphaerae TaxID=395937 RepID=UPI0028677716|nr:NUMOD4 domain-containing protein [Chryseobacterium rhizosphaerae]MDR6548495.1 hypothetical protein [Chryseobacterium rhizosphaerae]